MLASPLSVLLAVLIEAVHPRTVWETKRMLTQEEQQQVKASQVTWRGGSLVLPEAVLISERIHELLPFLAHAFYDYQGQIGEEDTTVFPDYVPLAPLIALTGNFLWLQVAYQHHRAPGKETWSWSGMRSRPC